MLALRILVDRLEKGYGSPPPLHTTDPLELILFEAVAYLATDARREAAFHALRERVGTRPSEILAAPLELLTEICRTGGMHAPVRAERLREIAATVQDRFQGDLRRALALPLQQALRELTRFPSIGAPGAEKILLFTRTLPVLALESNGLRVLARVFLGGEHKNYAATYRSVREIVAGQTGTDCAWLILAHRLLRQHGQECCTRNHPSCAICPLAKDCRYTRAI
jgi:endonuclease III